MTDGAGAATRACRALPRRTTPRRDTGAMTSRTALLLATVTVAALTLTACSDDGTATDGGTDAGTDSSSSSASTTPVASSATPTDPTPSAQGSTATADTIAVPLYFVGVTPQGPRLFREFQQVQADSALEEAAARVVGGQSLDPDYLTLWPAGGFAGVALDQTAGRIVVTLDVGGSPDEAVQLSPREARLALQQLVYTLQGVTQTRDRVVVETADGTPTSVFGIDTTDGIPAAKELNVLGLVNVTTPEQGAAVSGSFTAEGVASSFEASGPWELRAGDGAVVASGGYQAEAWIDGLYPFTAEVDLTGVAPGAYTFAALTDDPSGGTEGPGPTEDTKAITVQ